MRRKRNCFSFFLFLPGGCNLTGVSNPDGCFTEVNIAFIHSSLGFIIWAPGSDNFLFLEIYFALQINFILPAVLPARFINGSRIVYLWCPPVLKALFERRANELTKNGSSTRVVLQSTGRVDSKVRSVMSSNCSSHHNFVFIWFWTDTEKLSFRSGRWLSRWQFSWKVYVARCTLEEAFLKYFIRTDSEVLRCKFFFYEQLSATRGYKLNWKELSKDIFQSYATWNENKVWFRLTRPYKHESRQRRIRTFDFEHARWRSNKSSGDLAFEKW